MLDEVHFVSAWIDLGVDAIEEHRCAVVLMESIECGTPRTTDASLMELGRDAPTLHRLRTVAAGVTGPA